MKTALLLSGGLDSAAVALWQEPDLAITINYGQLPAAGEIRAACAICEHLAIEHVVVNASVAALGTGDLSGTEPIGLSPASEWWPYRNQYLVTVGAMKAIYHDVNQLMIGSVQTDSFHADGRSEFYELIDKLVYQQEGNIRVCAPAIDMTSEELIRVAGAKIDLLAWAHSCHKANRACGRCRGCFKYQETLRAIGYG